MDHMSIQKTARRYEEEFPSTVRNPNAKSAEAETHEFRSKSWNKGKNRRDYCSPLPFHPDVLSVWDSTDPCGGGAPLASQRIGALATAAAGMLQIPAGTDADPSRRTGVHLPPPRRVLHKENMSV
uniref:Uncharacterized protein n=1 Tax=Leersia perrieri TaxID=77586 RepID=A0A0D9W2L4_9ORYZ